MLEEGGDATYFDGVTDSPEAAAKLQNKKAYDAVRTLEEVPCHTGSQP